MKTKKLLLGALLSLFAFSASAAEVEHFTQTWLGTETVNYMDAGFSGTDTAFTVGETIYIKGTLEAGVTPTSVQLQIFDCVDWNSSVAIIDAEVNGAEVTGEYVIEDDKLLSNFPSGKNTKLALRIHIIYPDGNIEFDGWKAIRIEPVGGIYPEIFDPLFTATMTHIAADGTTTEYIQGEWVLFNGGPTAVAYTTPTIKAGDILQFKGTYLPEVGGAKVIAVGGHFSYTEAEDNSWAPNKFLHTFSEKGEFDGTFDFKIMVPYFIPEDILFNSSSWDLANSFYEHIQLRATYDDPTVEYDGGTLADAFANWQGSVAIWDGDKPTLGAAVKNVTVEANDSSATLNWNFEADAEWHVVFIEDGSGIRDPGFVEPTIVKSLPATIGGLKAGTSYKAYVRSVADPDTTGGKEPITGSYPALSEGISFTTTGTASLSTAEAAEVSIYPNPATDEVTIAADAAYAIEVSDLSGRVVLSTSMTSETAKLNVAGLNAGIYLVRFIDGDISFAKSFIKQ